VGVESGDETRNAKMSEAPAIYRHKDLNPEYIFN